MRYINFADFRHIIKINDFPVAGNKEASGTLVPYDIIYDLTLSFTVYDIICDIIDCDIVYDIIYMHISYMILHLLYSIRYHI
jgi:hypothetical protein